MLLAGGNVQPAGQWNAVGSESGVLQPGLSNPSTIPPASKVCACAQKAFCKKQKASWCWFLKYFDGAQPSEPDNVSFVEGEEQKGTLQKQGAFVFYMHQAKMGMNCRILPPRMKRWKTEWQ